MKVRKTLAARSPGTWAGHWWRFRQDRSGGVLVEMVSMIPVLVMLLLGAVEMAQYLLVHQKLNRAASTMADLVSQPATISASEVDELFDAATHLLEPFDLQNSGRVIVTSVSRSVEDPGPRIDWQREGAGTLSATSRIGIPNGPASMPDNFDVRDGENLIAAEVFFDYEPLFFSGLVESSVLWHHAYRRSRLGALSTIN